MLQIIKLFSGKPFSAKPIFLHKNFLSKVKVVRDAKEFQYGRHGDWSCESDIGWCINVTILSLIMSLFKSAEC